MDSPPSSSTWSDTAFLLSDDSGLLLTSGSISSGSFSGESRSGRNRLNMELLESDCEIKSLSQADSLDGMSDGGMCGENFNTLKKGPATNVWCVSIEPPPEFQDDPDIPPTPPPRYHRLPLWLDKLATHLMKSAIEDALTICCKVTWSFHYSPDTVAIVKPPRFVHNMIIPRLCWTPELFSYSSPCHHHHQQSQSHRPNSRNSLTPSRLSSSHNSLNLLTSGHGRVDDSTNFITQAVSHDALLNNNGISDIYNVPFDSDIYAVPVDVIKPRDQRTNNCNDKSRNYQRKRRRNVSSSSHTELQLAVASVSGRISTKAAAKSQVDIPIGKRHSVPGTTSGINNDNLIEQCNDDNEPIHMTLQEVRQYLQTLYSSSSSSDYSNTIDNNKNHKIKKTPQQNQTTSTSKSTLANGLHNSRKTKKNTFVINIKNRSKLNNKTETNNNNNTTNQVIEKRKQSPSTASSTSSTSLALGCSGGSKSIFSSVNLKHTICNLFRFRTKLTTTVSTSEDKFTVDDSSSTEVIQKRALPPLPANNSKNEAPASDSTVVIESADEELSMDFATNIEKVKNYGWYWGPISAEAAEKILSNEPEGSFIVRDSSDDHYIFSLSFKLNGCVRHVRIENYQGNFSFGSCAKFKSHTIVDFIENAVEHSRSGRYLFFLHRRPVLGPMRVQLLHPVSRFKQVQSLQHMCRFVILKLVRRDYIPNLPLPRRIIDYLSMKHYYSEMLSESEDSDGGRSSTSGHQIDAVEHVEHSIERDYA